MIRIAVIAALPGELKPLVRGWHHERRSGVDLWTKRHTDTEWVAACAGMGKPAASRAFAEVERSGDIDRVISVGWAGALRPEMEAGRAYRTAGVINILTGERYTVAGSSAGDPWLVTSPQVAGASEKRRLAAEYQAGLVDMEAAAIARLAAMRGIPFDCIKGVSDGFSENLPDFNRFLSPQGQLRISHLLFFVLPRPWYWPALIRMGENSKKASQNLTGLLLENLDNPGE
jgi:adenosylhomocysteine nucleosidase